MTHYIVQILAFQLLLLVVYDLFMKRETFFSGIGLPVLEAAARSTINQLPEIIPRE